MQRRQLLSGAAAAAAAAAVLMLLPEPASAINCPGMRGRELQQCLRKARQARETEEAERPTEGDKAKYDQPGELVTLPSGVQYREIETGTGREATVGSRCEISYTVYRLASGAYFKYSSGGTAVYMWSVGFGTEPGRDDLGATYDFTLGEPGSLPAAAAVGVMGMCVGGRRRILVPPAGGWVDDSVQPIPPTFGGRRRIAAHRDEPLLMEVLLVRVRSAGQDGSPAALEQDEPAYQPQGQPYKLPEPPSPFRKQLGAPPPAS